MEADEDLRFIFAPGSSRGGARPKAGVVDGAGQLWLARFRREVDDYSREFWAAVSLICGINALLVLHLIAGNQGIAEQRVRRPYLNWRCARIGSRYSSLRWPHVL